MATSLKGTVIVIRFPFSDLSASKRRPALVVADWGSNDVILAQITGVANKDRSAIELEDRDFVTGSLNNPMSFIRPNKLFTADNDTFLWTVGKLTEAKVRQVTDALYALLQAG